MVKRIRILSLLALFGLLALTGHSAVAAQDDSLDGSLDFSSIEGLQQVVGRYYGPDMEAAMNAMLTPVGEGTQTPSFDDLLSDATYLTTIVMKYDSDDTSEKGFNTFYDEAKQQTDQDASTQTEEVEIKDLGDEAKGMKGVIDQGGMKTNYFAILVRNGEYTFVISAVSSSAEVERLTTDVAKAVLDKKAGDGDGTFDENGASTGGLWDLFPVNGDAALGALVVLGDEITFPVPEGTPAP